MQDKFDSAAPSMIVKPDGSREWRNPYGNLHRDDGPALEYANGDKEWWRNGELHRDDGAAREFADGSKEWWRNGLLHRDDGPAIERSDGSKGWWRHGELHREDGPAVEWAIGERQWWRNGKQLTAGESAVLQQEQRHERERRANNRERQSAGAIQELLRQKALTRPARLKK